MSVVKVVLNIMNRVGGKHATRKPDFCRTPRALLIYYLLLSFTTAIYVVTIHYHADLHYHEDIECEFQQTGFVDKPAFYVNIGILRMKVLERIFYFASALFHTEFIFKKEIRGPPFFHFHQ